MPNMKFVHFYFHFVALSPYLLLCIVLYVFKSLRKNAVFLRFDRAIGFSYRDDHLFLTNNHYKLSIVNAKIGLYFCVWTSSCAAVTNMSGVNNCTVSSLLQALRIFLLIQSSSYCFKIDNM